MFLQLLLCYDIVMNFKRILYNEFYRMKVGMKWAQL